MKGRSYRDHHEDWVDGSWTVDCICGVNFDDGEEMVNCDDCGVWVHTRCSRYVKGEELFTCDKCKRKSNNNDNDSEETEVAQLLVELPTTTMRMENSCTRNMPLNRPFRLWTEIPIEEKVHVQGIPGGDQSLFGGLSSAFSRELWKCTGYVPKKFNFKYREFPCWDEQDKGEIDNRYQEEDGAGVLFSMSKENVITGPVRALVGMKSLDCKVANGFAKTAESLNSGEVGMKHSQGAMKKDKRFLRPMITNKRRKELFGASKERTKKKAEAADKEDDDKKGPTRSTSDSKPSETRKDTEPERFTTDVGTTKIEKSKKDVVEESTLKTGGDESGNKEIGVECSRERNLSDVHANGAGKQDEKAGHHLRIVLKSSVANDSSVLGEKDAPPNNANKEKQGTIADSPKDNAVDSPESLQKPSSGSTVGITGEVEETTCDDTSRKLGSEKSKFQKEMVYTSAGGSADKQTLDPNDSKVSGTSTSQVSGASVSNKLTTSGSLQDDHKPQPIDIVSEAISNGNRDRSSDLKREPMVSETEKDILKTKHGSGSLQEPSKPCRPVPHTFSVYGRPKMVVCIGKSSSSSATEKSSRCDDNNTKPSTSRGSKQQPSDGDANTNANDEDCVSSDLIRKEDGGDEPPEKDVKEHPKFSITSMKSTQQNRASHSSVSKTRESPSSSKASSVARINDGSCEAPGKHSLSGTFQKNEKPGQSVSQSASKNHVQSIISLAPNISDEELALRLHHQLNSSPRVPRVPRLRQPGSLPLSPTAPIFKRTSSSNSKDHATFSRRKTKDASKEGFRNFRDDDRCSTRSAKTRRSPDWRANQDRRSRRGSKKGEENGTHKASRKVLLPPNSNTSTSSGPSSSNELNEHSMPSPLSSPRNNGTPVHQTLPGLINQIMSKGKRMAYEELCNAVLPHWPHLRKHNGERYAYSSHSQAVLDCLRNRHEWARLVDRGPKTNSGKKKRKVDAAEEEEEEESDENESSKGGRKQLHHSQVEEFPKGKRKARKRRRLSVQEKGIKVLRKKRNQEEEEEASEEDEEDASSDTSEESMFCEEDEEEEERPSNGKDVSASSSEETQATS
ncbi:unnamed protein product [Cochlearia groenlandica]